MHCVDTELNGVKIIEPDVFADQRGWFFESYSAWKMDQLGISVIFVQDNHSYSERKGVIRGLHFQNEPMAQSKLVRCTHGSVMDCAVDIRIGSPDYRKWVSVELSSTNKKMLFIPKGFAHGFLTLEDDSEIQYKVDNFYSKEHDRSIRFDDPEIGIDWGVSEPLLSDKDAAAPLLSESDCNFLS
jgi:dTDP-4-dehydrorhamnose 3,5-epimerase